MQWVRTYWTRRTRGGPQAARRSALPEAFPLPDASPPFVHDVRMYEGTGYEPEFSLAEGLPPEDMVRLTEADGVLRVKLVPDHSSRELTGLEAGRKSEGVPLKRRHTLRWQVNYRLAAEWGWYYRLDTLNVAYGMWSAEVFVQPPVRRIDGRTLLYGGDSPHRTSPHRTRRARRTRS